MSIQAVAWVLEESDAEGVDRLVLIVLANHAGDEWIAWPSHRTIAREARVSRTTVPRSIDRLIALGELEIVEEGNPRRSARYRIRRDRGAATSGPHMGHPSGPPAAHQRPTLSGPPAAHQRPTQGGPEPKPLNREPAGAREADVIPMAEGALRIRHMRAELEAVR